MREIWNSAWNRSDAIAVFNFYFPALIRSIDCLCLHHASFLIRRTVGSHHVERRRHYSLGCDCWRMALIWLCWDDGIESHWAQQRRSLESFKAWVDAKCRGHQEVEICFLHAIYSLAVVTLVVNELVRSSGLPWWTMSVADEPVSLSGAFGQIKRPLAVKTGHRIWGKWVLLYPPHFVGWTIVCKEKDVWACER